MCAYGSRIIADSKSVGSKNWMNKTVRKRIQKSSSAQNGPEADFDEHCADVRSFGCNGHYHRDYDYRGYE